MTAAAARDILQALIRCPSVTPAEGGALTYLAGLLRGAGFDVHLPVFATEGEPPVTNLYARHGTGSPCLVFAGHTDVVPPGDPASWRFPPFSGEVSGGMIWGRGAADMKGGVAAAVAAALDAVADRDLRGGSIILLLTGDEEGPATNGTVKLLAWARGRGERFDHCILGEPTNPRRLGEMIKIGRRGSLTGEVTVRGKQGHVAYPHLADNPIPRLVRLLQALTAVPLDAGTARFDPSNLELVTVDVGNPAANVIPASARARFNVRFNDLWSPEALREQIDRRLAGAGAGPYEVGFESCNAVSFVTAPGPFTTLVADAVAAETGLRPALSTTGGTSDARFIAAHCPVVEFGLVGDTMHQVDERVSLDDLARLERVYARVIERYFGGDWQRLAAEGPDAWSG